MSWKGNPNEHTGNEVADISYPPTGGWLKMIILGIILPFIIVYFGHKIWVTEEAVWFGQRDSRMTVHGKTAIALAVTYFSAAFFCHCRWFWGLIPIYWIFEFGTVISLLGIVGGLGYGAYRLFIL